MFQFVKNFMNNFINLNDVQLCVLYSPNLTLKRLHKCIREEIVVVKQLLIHFYVIYVMYYFFKDIR